MSPRAIVGRWRARRRPVRVDEWLLHDQETPSASGGRGLGRGRIFTRDGRLVATTVQEGLVRLQR